MADENIKQQIVEALKKNGQILDINLSRYFDIHPWLFHDKVKSGPNSANYMFWGIVQGTSQYSQIGIGPDSFTNIGLTMIEPMTEACMLTKENLADLYQVIPQHKNEIDELIENIQ